MFITILTSLYVFVLIATISVAVALVKSKGGSWTELLDYILFAFIPVLNIFTLIGLVSMLSETKPFQSEVFKKD